MRIQPLLNPGRVTVVYDNLGRPYPRSKWLMNVMFETTQEMYDAGAVSPGRVVAWPRCWEPVGYV